MTSSETGNAWVGTISAEGNVTTVINESGSVWGGTATLVEEASIGVEIGAEEYMFGQVNSIYATDQRIYVADAQVPVVRVYDHDGNFLMNLGRSGQGPGEYQYLAVVAADSSDRAFVLAIRNGRINVYAPTGEPLEPWPFTSSRCCGWPMYTLTDEVIWAPVQEWLEDRSDRRYGVRTIGPSGPYGEVTWVPELEYEQATFEVREGFDAATPFSARLAWTPAPDGRLLVGASDRYRFEVHERDGSMLIVERYWKPVPVPAEHREWERRYTTAAYAYTNDLPDVAWDGAGMPDHKPAYNGLIPTLSGAMWVARPGTSERVPDCVEDPTRESYLEAYASRCWTDQRILDAFGPDGRYLGDVQPPEGLWSTGMVIDGRRVIAVIQDREGTLMVKRYRLVLPAEQ